MAISLTSINSTTTTTASVRATGKPMSRCTLARDAGPDIQVDGVVSTADMVTIRARNSASTAPVLVSVSLARD